MRLIIRSACHQWSKGGTHIGWRKGKELQAIVLEILGFNLAKSTAHRYLAEEIATHDGRTKTIPLLQQPNVPKLVAEWKAQTTSSSSQEQGHATTFLPAWRTMLKEKCMPFIDTIGFGPLLVQSLAAHIYKEQMGDEFIMSIVWCLQFMRTDLNLQFRRITGARSTPQQEEIQRRLHRINLQRFAVAHKEHLPLK